MFITTRTFIFITILLLAITLRFFLLDKVPLSPYWEEVALGYDAYSIAQTGRDHHGNVLPVVSFPSYGDYKPSGYFYTLVPFVKLFGLNMWAVRLPSAIAGVMSVVLVYLIARKITNEKTALIASALYAIQPWSLQFSRAGFEVNVALMCILLGVYLLVLSYKKPWFLPLSVLAFGASMYTYHAARLFAPLVGAVGGVYLLFSWFKISPKFTPSRYIPSTLVSFVLALVLVFPFISNLGNQEVSSRFSQTSIFTDLEPILKSNEQIEKHGNTRFAKILYHRFWYFGYQIGKNILSFLSPEFLFWKGDGSLRHGVTKYGLLYPVESIFIVFAIVSTLRSRKDRHKQGMIVVVMIIWIGLSTLAPAVVKPTPHALRFLFASPAFTLLSAIGITSLLSVLKEKERTFLGIAICIACMYSSVLYLHWYYRVYPAKSAQDFQYGYKELYQTLADHKQAGEHVFVSREQGRPSMFYLFYTSYDPQTIQQKGKDFPKDQLELLQVDEYYFVDGIPSQSGLFATSPEKRHANSTIISTIYAPDGSVVWEVWRRK